MSKRILFSVLIMLPIAQSCISYSTLQTARAIGDEKLSITVAGSSVNSGVQFEENEDFRVPMMEVQGIYGWNDRLDIQAKIGLVGMSGLGFKYQFVGNQTSKIAVASGLHAGILTSSSTSGNTLLTEVSLPLYISWHPKEWLALYGAPRFTHRVNRDYEITDPNTGETKLASKTPNNYMGGTAGIRLGKKLGFLMEYSKYSNIALSGSRDQISIGITYGGLKF